MSETREPDWLQHEREYDDDLAEYGTLAELFEMSAEQNLDSDAQMYKGGVYDRSLTEAGVVSKASNGKYATLSYRKMRDIVRHLATGFREIGLNRQDRVGLFANTRMEWAQCDFALLGAGCVVTTVYTDSSPEQAEYLLGDPGATGVVVENEILLDRVLEVEDELDLEVIVLIDQPESSYDRDDIYTLGEVHDIGEDAFEETQYQEWVDETDPDDLASLIYTSGTTGKPKGVRLTHWNFRSNFHAIRRRVGPREDDPDRLAIDSHSRAISFLPLAHVFERQAGHFLMFGSGGTVGYAESTDTIAEDLEKIEPTCCGSVPRVYERIFDRMRDQAGEGPEGLVRKPLFTWALEVNKKYQEKERPGPLLEMQHSLADSLVYEQVRKSLGGNIEIMVSGGGSLNTELCRIFNGMGLTIVEGYGLSETSPVISVNSPEDIRPGTLGVPVVGVDIAIDESKDVNEDFEAEDSIIGELLVRGDSVTDGYWNKPGATERAFTADPFEDEESEVTAIETAADGSGKWLRTGDLVEQTPDGFLIFHERLKQLLVLDTGKNVAPQPIEDAFATNDCVEQIMVVGDGEKFIGALIVPNYERLESWAKRNDVDLPDSREAMVDDEEVLAWIEETVEEVNENFEKHEKIKKFALAEEEWTPENDLLTPSMKKKRRTIMDVYEEKIDEIYSD
jgi:long-chain acyl-CoA synthetase